MILIIAIYVFDQVHVFWLIFALSIICFLSKLPMSYSWTGPFSSHSNGMEGEILGLGPTACVCVTNWKQKCFLLEPHCFMHGYQFFLKKNGSKTKVFACFFCLKQEKGIWSKNRPFVKAYFLEVVRKRLLNWIVFICSKKCMINVDLRWGFLTRKYNKQLFYRKAFSIKLHVVEHAFW